MGKGSQNQCQLLVVVVVHAVGSVVCVCVCARMHACMPVCECVDFLVSFFNEIKQDYLP